jgi:hypothetical protein
VTVRSVPPAREGLVEAVEASLKAMDWLGPADAGLVALAKAYAMEIDAADDVKTVRWVGPQLFNVLKALGGSPADRKALGLEQNVRGKLDELRKARDKRAARP